MSTAVAVTIAMTATAATGILSARTRPGYASSGGRRRQLRVGRRLRRRVPRLPVRLQRRGLRAACHGSRRQAGPHRGERARRRRDRRPGRARGTRRDRGAAERARPLPRPALAGALARAGRVARLLVEEARLPRRVARPARQGRKARGVVRRGRRRVRLPRSRRRAGAARGPPDAELAFGAVPPMTPRWYAVAGPAYLAALLAL